MRVFQVLPTLAYGDAIGNDTIALEKVIREMGYHTEIYADSIVPPLNEKTAKLFSKMPGIKSDDVILYHLSTGNELNYKIAELPGKKVIIYHNVTPPEFFYGVDNFIYKINKWALDAVSFLSDKVDYCIADSSFNRQDLLDIGYTCPIDVVPVVIPFDDYKKKPNQQILERYNDGQTNIIFTGRIAPNKKQEDIIRAFCMYKKYFNSGARLFLVGSYKEEDIYYRKLVAYVEQLDLEDVYFTGHIKFDEILAYYHLADVLLCMSEHEGFCVPLVEAMLFDVPIIAYDSTAIPYTLGGSGILLNDKDPLIVAKMIDKLMKDTKLYERVVFNQKIRLADFEYNKIKKQFSRCLEQFIGGDK